MRVREVIENIYKLKAFLEVYKQIDIFLQEFISTDNREAKKYISIEGSEGNFVSDEVLEEIREKINNLYIDPIEKEIQTFEERLIQI